MELELELELDRFRRKEGIFLVILAYILSQDNPSGVGKLTSRKQHVRSLPKIGVAKHNPNKAFVQYLGRFIGPLEN